MEDTRMYFSRGLKIATDTKVGAFLKQNELEKIFQIMLGVASSSWCQRHDGNTMRMQKQNTMKHDGVFSINLHDTVRHRVLSRIAAS